MITIEGGVCAAKGFKAGGIHAGIKKDPTKKDLAIICCETKCNAAALFTTNKVQAAPIAVSKNHLSDGRASAIIVNSGNANACNANGTEVAEKMCSLAAESLGINHEDVIVASTGVIGQELVIDDFVMDYNGSDSAAEAIMTTDTFSKQYAVEFYLSDGTECRVGGIAKGSGMINPNMATMLAFITTDVSITPELLQEFLRVNNEKTFNRVSVDGDTSTNDMVCIMASGLAGNKTFTSKSYDSRNFAYALYLVMKNLAKMMARDGEGATKLIQCKVSGAGSKVIARSVADSVISSSLVKAALGAADANWGRILCAIGYAKGSFDISRVEVKLSSSSSAKGEITVCKDGAGVPFCEEQASSILSEDEVTVFINLNSGNQKATSWGCDLTEEYVRINADYRS